jgi:FkbM family methyltransferase
MVNELGYDGTYQMGHLEAALSYVTDWGCAIDGGAHIGTWSRAMSAKFGSVVSFEPSPDTYECLVQNMSAFGCANVACHHAALGGVAGSVSVMWDAVNEARANTGARYVTKIGNIPMVTVDSFNLDHIGFLKLDVEGSEPDALRGAVTTIHRCRPIVLFEDKGLWKRHYGLPRDTVQRFLTGIGYQRLERVSMDEIWGPPS